MEDPDLNGKGKEDNGEDHEGMPSSDDNSSLGDYDDGNTKQEPDEELLECDRDDSQACQEAIDAMKEKLDPENLDDDSQDEATNLVDEFADSIKNYQVMPELLEPRLTGWIVQITEHLETDKDDVRCTLRYHTTFKFLYQLARLAGFKSLCSKFPSDTNKLPLLIELIEREDPEDLKNWETRFVLIVWLSIVILTPFDLSKFESSAGGEQIGDKIFRLLVPSLKLHNSSQQAAAYCLAKLFSRADQLRTRNNLDEFITVSLEEIKKLETDPVKYSSSYLIIGYLRTLCYMYKFMPRDELKPLSPRILAAVGGIDMPKINSILVNQLLIKVVQRAGLALLPHRAAPWRCLRPSRVLGRSEKPISEQQAEPAGDDDGDDFDGEILEQIMSMLFVANQNNQTVVRYSAAKGIARITNRLSRARAKEVVSEVVSRSFHRMTSSEFAWHGGCLALAEMCRNGLIMEEMLGEVMQKVNEAIVYDRIKGSFSTGAHVREAACYVCWAISRNYKDEVIKPYIDDLMTNLVCTSLFDREGTCRRSASASIQELIGRQGTFDPRIIKILDELDYTAVGQREKAFKQISLEVAKTNEIYVLPFVRYLLTYKVSHWDLEMREFAAETLGSLMLYLKHEFVQLEVLSRLMMYCDQDLELNRKHGGILSLSSVLYCLHNSGYKFQSYMPEFVCHMAEKCGRALKNKAHASNMIAALVSLIRTTEKVGFQYSRKPDVVKRWRDLAFTGLDNDSVQIRDAAAEALLVLYRYHYQGNKTGQDNILTCLNKKTSGPHENSRCGALRCLGKLALINKCEPSEGIRTDADTADIILITLTSYLGRNTRDTDKKVYAFAMAEACDSFATFVGNLDQMQRIQATTMITDGIEKLIIKTEDYTFDKERGDVGVTVRRTAVLSLFKILSIASQAKWDSLFTEALVRKTLAAFLQQAVSYHDATRNACARTFYELLSLGQVATHTPHLKHILDEFTAHQIDENCHWLGAQIVPVFVDLLEKPEYSEPIWLGLLPSVGQPSLTSSKMFRIPLTVLISRLEDHKCGTGSSDARCAHMDQVIGSFVSTLAHLEPTSRMMSHALSTLDFMLVDGLLRRANESEQRELLNITCRAKDQCKNDSKKLLTIARVLSGFSSFRAVQSEAIKNSIALLANGFPSVREAASQALYTVFMTHQSDIQAWLKESASSVEGEGEDGSTATDEGDSQTAAPSKELDLTDAMDLLSSSNWRASVDECRLKSIELKKILKFTSTVSD